VIQHIAVAFDISNTRAKGFVARRKEIYEYPLVALREAIINAVTHRDYYYDSSHIYVHLYPDRIEIENPGGLLHGLTVESLGKRSARRNRLIADLLDRSGYIERVGSGFARMAHALHENNNPELQVSATNFFNICFYRRPVEFAAAMLSPRQIRLYELIKAQNMVTVSRVASVLHVSHDTARRELKALLDYDVIEKIGEGKATVYKQKG
jgi:ATP-dependent DNA helicase RecG